MSNGKWWTDQEHPLSSSEEATRAVSRDQFLSAVTPPNQPPPSVSNPSLGPLTSPLASPLASPPTSLRDQTRVAQADSFPSQDPTKALNADQFYQMTAKLDTFEHDTSEDKTKALNTADFNFQSPFNPQVSHPQVSHPQVQPWQAPLSSQSPTQSQNLPVVTEPYSIPSVSQYPSPQPRRSPSNSFNEPQTPIISNPSLSPNLETAPKNSTAPWQTDSPDLAQQDVNQVLPLSSPHFEQEDLTQAHLKSHVLAELISEHRFQDNSPTGQEQDVFKKDKSQRVKRSRHIIYSSVFLSLLIIFVALGARYLLSAPNLDQRLTELNLSLTELKAPFALNLPSALAGRQQKSARAMQQNTLEQQSSLQVLFNEATLFYADDQSKVHNTLSVSAGDLMPQAHPLRLNGAFLPKVIHQLNHHWPETKLQQVVLGAPQSSSAGMVLDLLSTFVVNHQRKGQSFTQYNLLIEQKTAMQVPQIKKSTPSNRKLAMLPFQLLVDNKQIDRDEFLQVKWSKTQNSILILGPKRKERARFQLQRLRASHEEDLLTQTFKAKVDQIGALKGILISVPRSILLTELALWLSVCAPYPVYLIPPKVSN